MPATSFAATTKAEHPLPDTSALGPLKIACADIERVSRYWQTVIGLTQLSHDGEIVTLGTGTDPLLELERRPGATPPPADATGLFHVAMLVPSREALGRFLRRCISRGHMLDGASDHGVSEALYFTDPEGNGIEIYADRPRELWSSEGFGSFPLDAEGLIGSVTDDTDDGGTLATGTVVGHMHLKVADVERDEAWYRDIFGFDVMIRLAGSASFLSFGGYHHHVGMNTWHSAGGPTPGPGHSGLVESRLSVTAETLAELEGRLSAAAHAYENAGNGLFFRDPSGNAWRVTITH